GEGPKTNPGRANGAPDRDDADDAPRDDEPSWGIVSLGALAHVSMSLKSALIRRIEAQRAARPALRREPAFDLPAPPPVSKPAPPPFVAKPVVHDEDEEAAPEAAEPPAPASTVIEK